MSSALVVLFLFFLFRAFPGGAQTDIALPTPSPRKAFGFEESLKKVRTDRTYSEKPVRMEDLSYVLWAAGGRDFDTNAVSGASRTYPSAFGIYPVKVYLLVGAVQGVKPGVYQYVAAGHGLRLLKAGDRRKESIQGSTFARFVAQAPLTIVLAADFTSMTAAFGDRGRNVYLPVEAGHLSQILRLTATATGMSSCTVGAFDPARIKDLFGIKEEPLLLLPMGYPLSDR